MTSFQLKCCSAVLRCPNQVASISKIAGMVRSSRIAVASAMQSLERKGMAHHFASEVSQWAVSIWGITPIGRNEMQEGR